MWLMISVAYLEVMRAFVASPQLGSMTLGKSMLLLAASGAASVFQLPVIGWFTQIGAVAAVMVSIYGASPEASTGCAATLLLVTFLSIAPVGDSNHIELTSTWPSPLFAGCRRSSMNASDDVMKSMMRNVRK